MAHIVITGKCDSGPIEAYAPQPSLQPKLTLIMLSATDNIMSQLPVDHDSRFDKILNIGIASAEAYKTRTMAIARGELKPSAQSPKVWFTSIDSVAKVLSDRNRELLALIAAEKPNSLQALVDRTGRAKSNLSRTLRTLRTMERYGLVRFEKGQGLALAPRVVYDDIRLDLPLRVKPAAM